MRLKTTACMVALVAASPVLQAENRDWRGEGEIGFLMSSGNTDESNLNARLELIHEVEKWRNIGEFRSNVSESEGTTSAERYRAALETNYKFSERQFWYLRGSFEDDRFSGYDFQASATTGYGHRVWESGARSFLDLSAGVGYRFSKLDEADETGSRDEEEMIARVAGQFDYSLSETALFRQKLSSEIGLDENNVISESETSLQATIIGNLSLKAAFNVKHVSDAPADSTSTDKVTSLSLLYGF